MTFARAFQEAVEKQADNKKLKTQVESNIKKQKTQESEKIYVDSEQVPMMYRAQVSGRCSLQYANQNKNNGKEDDLTCWTKEWVNPHEDNNEPSAQLSEPPLELNESVYRFKINFPWRVFTDCGQDSISRPVIGKKGIPIITGSSLKGVFRRLLNDNSLSKENREKIKNYCGTEKKQGTLRFLGAYPIDDWASTKKVKLEDKPEETRYQMVDICHPQQAKQVGVKNRTSSNAIALISLFKPTLVFELSSIHPLENQQWQDIKQLCKKAFEQGLGGKTSTSYGLYSFPQDKYQYPLSFYLKAKGVTPLLRNNEPEFRPNLFKAVLRGHTRRLLGGITKDERKINNVIDRFFGSNTSGNLEIYWESLPRFLQYENYGDEKTPVYENEGYLYLDLKSSHSKQKHKDEDIKLIQNIMTFAYTMAGFGKSWRRIYHPQFYPSYTKRAIGCHWQGNWNKTFNDEKPIQNPQDLTSVLTSVYQNCQNYLQITTPQRMTDWREAWHPDNVKVYAQKVEDSQVVTLFHEDRFKKIPAIGGKERRKNKNGEEKVNFLVSHVWHRMLPISNNDYLEIVTIFKGDTQNWNGNKSTFERAIQDRGLTLIWGNNSS